MWPQIKLVFQKFTLLWHNFTFDIAKRTSFVISLKKNTIENYKVPTSTMAFLKDTKGIVWLGCTGGLYKINKAGETKNVTSNGPWN